MLGRDVGENAPMKPDETVAVLGNAFGRYLKDDRAAARAARLGEEPLEVETPRHGHFQKVRLLTIIDLESERRNRSNARTRGAEHIMQRVDYGRLAVRAGNADNRNATTRKSIDERGRARPEKMVGRAERPHERYGEKFFDHIEKHQSLE